MKRIFKKSLPILAALVAGAQVAMGEVPPPIARNLYVGAASDTVLGFDGLPVPDGAYIEFRAMYKAGSVWKAYSPQSDQIVRNPLLTTSSVGSGVIRSARGRGRFAACVCGLATTNAYVVRLFDGPSPEESVAYCDSRPFTYDADATRSITNVLFTTWKALNGSELADTDGDGLVDIVETSLAATDPDDWDTDGDGFSDGFEYTHDMNPLDSYQLAIQLEIESPDVEACLAAGLEPEPLYALSWAALSGKTYQVEFQPTMMPEKSEDEWKVIAEETIPETTNRFMYNLEDIEDDGIFEWIRSHSAFFRVRKMGSPSDSETVADEVPPGE